MSQNPAEQLAVLNDAIIACRRCPRLVAYRETVARVKRRAYLHWAYWGRPVPGFGDARAQLLIVGLAPAAHGANRTGRVFTGDGIANLYIPRLGRDYAFTIVEGTDDASLEKGPGHYVGTALPAAVEPGDTVRLGRLAEFVERPEPSIPSMTTSVPVISAGSKPTSGSPKK